METITRYRVNDGSEFVDHDKAKAYEALCRQTGGFMALLDLPPEKDDCNFANGGGYLQHDPGAIAKVRESLHQVARGSSKCPGPLYRLISGCEGGYDNMALEAHPSWYVRMLDGSCRTLGQAFNRLCCIDDKGREWGQMYFVINPREGKQVCLNA